MAALLRKRKEIEEGYKLLKKYLKNTKQGKDRADK